MWYMQYPIILNLILKKSAPDHCMTFAGEFILKVNKHQLYKMTHFKQKKKS